MIKKLSLILLFLTLNLTISLKSTDFCIPKQQNECKGYYDRHKKYQIKCKTIKCHGTFNYDCGSEICSNNMTECKKYNQIKHIINNPFRERIVLSIFKQFLISLVDFLEIVELLLLCYFYFLLAIYLIYLASYLFWVRPDITTPVVLFTLIFLI